MLSIRNVDAYYGESRIFDDLSLDILDDKITCLIGRNGVGKSTALKVIMGLVRTTKGRVVYNNKELRKMQPYNRVKLGIGYVPQGRDIFARTTVQENLELGLIAQGKNAKVPDYIYDLFPILKEFAKRKGGDLSGGQQQQLAIARALVMNPGLLILDEPTEGIQPSIIKDIGTAIKQINKETRLTVLIVEQYLDFALDIADMIYVMDKGKVLIEGRTSRYGSDEVQAAMLNHNTEGA
ncbi:MAG: urea ABC transporter ATP-binding subunit UrtE [Oscillospiraceae bacterium]|jgi:urea transport system ATP-binding protein|nr:urea ABC transporter ATP-binding subunit UrtE [Oscillospiraceae bacterium]